MTPIHLQMSRPGGYGALAFGALLALYFAALTAVSGWRFTVSQFSELFWAGLLLNAAGIVFIATRLAKAREHAQ